MPNEITITNVLQRYDEALNRFREQIALLKLVGLAHRPGVYATFKECVRIYEVYYALFEQPPRTSSRGALKPLHDLRAFDNARERGIATSELDRHLVKLRGEIHD